VVSERDGGRKQPAQAWTAERVAALRAALGLTQAGFAGELGVRQQTVSEWETGRYQPRGASARLLRMLAESRVPYGGGAEQRAQSEEGS
jgi:DNA-binding transcriptional regulator YiaG